MMSLAFGLAAIFLGFPLVIGLWTVALKVKKFLNTHLSSQNAFVALLVLLAGLVCLVTAPVYILGTNGYLVVCGVYVLFVALGAKRSWRILSLMQNELDGDDSNDVPLPGGDKNKKEDKKS